MEVFTIYHIPGIKVGATKDLKKRTRQNKRRHGKDITVEVLQRTTCIDMADEKENEYSIHLGYGEIPTNQRYKVRYMVGKNKERNKKISKANTGENNGRYGFDFNGANNPNYGTGKLFKDLISGFVGYRNEIRNQFPGINIYTSVDKSNPMIRKDGTVVHLVTIKQPAL